ncbi:MAG: recombinase family protein, partial [Alphaproteobacteria bacterium]|nr:recombinase family protein [Alphaproteobacteria bacterium]
MPISVAIYARHSTDKQALSVDQQIERCKAYCKKNGYIVADIFFDKAISGASVINRSGFSDLIDASMDGCFQRVIAEDLSRISRDLSDMAYFYRKMRFLDVALETVTEGEIHEVHIGMKGTMNDLYLKDLGDKTRRGQIASVLKGSIPGGETYGYDKSIVHDEAGERIPGVRTINEEQAKIVRWIFQEYVKGASLVSICETLNRQGIPSPKGGKWVKTTLIGQMARKTGLLRQTLYKGVVTFNRMMFRKNPDTGKRQSFLRPEKEWIQVPVPELAIIDEETFERVQHAIEERSSLHKQRLLLDKVLANHEKERLNSHSKCNTAMLRSCDGH